jgi:ABC-2 type transport system ATP-binding protein
MGQAISLENVGFSYQNKKGIQGISFEGMEGEVLCLLGKNGSGKSTLLRIISTLVRPQVGSVSILGLDASQHRTKIRGSMFTVFDENAHFDFASGHENLRFFLNAYRQPFTSDVGSFQEQMSFDLSMKVGEYSYGMRRKLYLLEAFLSRRRILMFDEPTLGLDSASRTYFFHLCEQARKMGTTIIISTNRLEDVRNSDHVYYLENGRGRPLSSTDAVSVQSIVVTISTVQEEVVEHISTLDELPALIHQYLRLGTIRRIDVDCGLNDALEWTKEALEKIDRAPGFIRKMIHRVVEEYARSHDIGLITPSVVEASRERFERR